MPKIHDLSDLNLDEAYDETQTNDEIQDGDFLILGCGVAYMQKAWPFMVEVKFGQMEPNGFHRYADHNVMQEKKDEFEALKRERNWHPTLTPHEIAIAIITLTMMQTGASDAYELEHEKLREAFEAWRSANSFGMGDDVERALIRLGFTS